MSDLGRQRSRARSARTLRLARVSLLSAALLACKEDKPYTPFEVATALPPQPNAEGAPPPVETAPPAPTEAPVRRALRAPRDATTWKVGDMNLKAPEGQVFELALPLAAPPEGTSPGVVAWTMRKSDGKSPTTGGLWLYAGSSVRRLLDFPGFVPVGPECEHAANLDQTGPGTVTFEVRARCSARLVARAPTRAVVVLHPLRSDPVLLGFRAADPAPGESLDLTIDSRDLDGDGRDDLTLRVAVASEGQKKPASAEFAWFDRAAGRSRNPREPAASFAAAAGRLQSQSKSKRDAPGVAAGANALRRLYASLCAESGTPRVWTFEGAPLPCAAESSLTTALSAEIDAALSQGRPVEALGLLERESWFGGKFTDKERARLEQSVSAKLRPVDAEVTGSFPADVQAPAEPHWSPLRFEGERLWVRTTDGHVLSSDPPGTPARDANLGVAGAAHQSTVPEPWPLRVTDASGRTWTAVVPSCDRSELQVAFVARDGAPLPLLPVPVLAPRPGLCKPGSRQTPSAHPLRWHEGRLELWAGGQRVVAEGAFGGPAPGAAPPRESVPVVSSKLGPLVLQNDRETLWRGDATRGVTDCAASADGRLLACLRGRSVVVLKKTTPSAQ